MSKIKLKYGLKDQNLVHISEVDSGLSCSCFCPSCGEMLVAKKGLKRENHFAHSVGSSCEHAIETSLHLAAKEVLAKHRKITLPPVKVEFRSNRSSLEISSSKTVSLDTVELEKTIEDIVPDLIVSVKGRKLLIEIYVTHKVDEKKLEKIKSLDISTLEIDLSKVPRDMKLKDLEDVILNQLESKRWVYNSYSKHVFKKMLAESKPLKMVSRGFALHIDYCPRRIRVWRGKPYANFIDDCAHCENCIDVSGNEIMCSYSSR